VVRRAGDGGAVAHRCGRSDAVLRRGRCQLDGSRSSSGARCSSVTSNEGKG
jgi:hypothetical protein